MSEQDQDKPPKEVPVSEPEGSPSEPEGSPTVEAAAEPEPPKEEKPPWLLNPQVPEWQDEDDRVVLGTGRGPALYDIHDRPDGRDKQQ